MLLIFRNEQIFLVNYFLHHLIHLFTMKMFHKLFSRSAREGFIGFIGIFIENYVSSKNFAKLFYRFIFYSKAKDSDSIKKENYTGIISFH